MESDLQIGDNVRVKCSSVLAVISVITIIDDERVYQVDINGVRHTYKGFDNWYTRDQLKTKEEEN